VDGVSLLGGMRGPRGDDGANGATGSSGVQRVGATISALGAPHDFDQALIRIGDSAKGYRYIGLIYDPAKNKWVGPEVRHPWVNKSTNTTNQTAYTQNGLYNSTTATHRLHVPDYKAFRDAGMQLELRMFGIFSITGGATGSLSWMYSTNNEGQALAGTGAWTAHGSDLLQTTSATGLFRDTYWIPLAPHTVADNLAVEIVGKSSSGAQSLTISDFTITHRWVGI
jgi:hypothetical protein